MTGLPGSDVAMNQQSASSLMVMPGAPTTSGTNGEATSASKSWKSRCLLLEQLVQALETNRHLLQLRVRRAERAADTAKQELHALQRMVFSARDQVTAAGRRPTLGQNRLARVHALDVVRTLSKRSPTSASDDNSEDTGRQIASTRRLERCTAIATWSDSATRRVGQCPAALLTAPLLQRVFRLLDPQALVRTAQVCRRWRDLVDQPTLWKFLELQYPPLTPMRTPMHTDMRHVTAETPTARFLVAAAEPALQRAKAELQRTEKAAVTRGLTSNAAAAGDVAIHRSLVARIPAA